MAGKISFANRNWRDTAWSSLDQSWDLIVIGGGITGAGILREALRAGLHTLLVEARDFASGTSSRSSKLVHGGLRYLKNRQIRMTLEAVSERERFLKEGRGLVSPLNFLLPTYKGDAIPGWVFDIGLMLYDLLAFRWGHRHYDALDMKDLCPSLSDVGLEGGFRYFDAQTDDARLVLRLIQEATADGGVALNYTPAISLLRQRSGKVCGVALRDESPNGDGRTVEVQASVVVNATGAWADNLRSQVGQRNRLRKLRGSHLVFPAEKVPLTRAISFLHPWDNRPVFAIPWEGVVIIGTTDVDHGTSLDEEPAISSQEAEYLLQGARTIFPSLDLDMNDVRVTYSGVRPVVNTGKADPSKESREHVLWSESGLLTVTGGKLTTFRLMAHNALEKVRARLPGHPAFDPNVRMLDEPPAVTLPEGLKPSARLRLVGRHGANVTAIIEAAQPGEMAPIEHTPLIWAELRWAARAEAVEHLDDLLLRRVRLGLLLPEGGLPYLEPIRQIAQSELGWDDRRWTAEADRYAALWKKNYQPPG